MDKNDFGWLVLFPAWLLLGLCIPTERYLTVLQKQAASRIFSHDSQQQVLQNNLHFNKHLEGCVKVPSKKHYDWELKYKGLGGIQRLIQQLPMNLVHWFFKIFFVGLCYVFWPIHLTPHTFTHRTRVLGNTILLCNCKIKINKNDPNEQQTSTPCRMDDDVWARNTFLFNSCPILNHGG